MDKTVRVWEVATGKELRRLDGHQGWVFAVVFSSDGRLLASGDGGDEPTIRVWHAASGREVRRFRVPPRGTHYLNFSTDGKTLASTGRDQTIRLWELATGQERARLRGTDYAISGVAFSPAGRMLVSGSQDSTALIWDVTGLMRDGRLPTVSVSPQKLKTLWAELAEGDAAKAWRALWALSASAKQTVPLLNEQLSPASIVSAERITRLIADLDSDQFAVREKTERQLEKIGEEAEAALRKTLAARPSAEVRRRVEQLLEKLERGILPGTRLQQLRAIEVLEHIGTPDAQEVLKKLAKGAPEARLTQEAKAALARLGKQRSGKD